MLTQDNIYYKYNNKTFTEVWPNVESFINDYKNNGITAIVKEDKVNVLYYLLYARYGNSTPKNSDENQFKYNVFALIFMYGPAWEERLNLQEKIRGLTDEELQVGGKAIYNKAYNPTETGKSTQTLEDLQFISEQNVTNYKKAKIDAYALKWDLISKDVTEEFLRRFQKLFKSILEPLCPVTYKTPEGEI